MKHAYGEAEQRCEHDRTDPDGEVAALQRRIRELEVEVKVLKLCQASNEQLIDEMDAELNAEKAMADDLERVAHGVSWDHPARAAYRKARGL